MQQLQQAFDVSERLACRVIDQPRSAQRYAAHTRDEKVALSRRMQELAQERPRFGCLRIGRLLRREQWQASDTRVYRLQRQDALGRSF